MKSTAQSTGSRRDAIIGTAAVIISSIAYGIQPTISAVILGMCETESTYYYSITGFAALIFAGILLYRKESFLVSRKIFWEILVMSLCGITFCQLLFGLSFRYIPVAMTELFHFCYPAMVILIMVVIFRQKLTWIKVIAVAMAFAGVLLITDLSSSVSLWGCFVALLSGFLYGIYIIANDRSHVGEISPIRLSFWISLISSVTTFIVAIVTGAPLLLPNSKALLLTMGSALWGSALPMITMIYGVRRLGASRTVLLNNIEPLVGVIVSTIIFQTGVTLRLILACICILGCSVMSGFVKDTKNEQK